MSFPHLVWTFECYWWTQERKRGIILREMEEEYGADQFYRWRSPSGNPWKEKPYSVTKLPTIIKIQNRVSSLEPHPKEESLLIKNAEMVQASRRGRLQSGQAGCVCG